MRLGQAISSLLTEYGTRHIFGIPGVHTLELFRDISESGLRVVIPRHEQGAGFMADAYTRVSGRPGVCYLITGPGVLNALTPIAQAWHDSIPLLIIGSTVTREQLGAHRGTLHDTPDLAPVLRPFALISETVTNAERAAELIDEAFRRWETERPRPVYIGIPRDLLEEEVGELHRPVADPLAPTPLPEGASAESDAAAEALGDALGAIRTARRPIIIAGGGARHDGPAVRALAERLAAPVILTGNAKGLLPEAHPLNAGISLPFPRTQELATEADLVLALGTELSDFEVLFTGTPEPRLTNIVRVDIDPDVAHPDQSRPTLPLRVGAFIERALAELPGASHDGRAAGAARATAAQAGLAAARAADPHTPWIDAISRALPATAILTADSAQVAYQAHHFLPLDEPGRWLAPYGYGTLGPALPMAIGAALAAPESPVVALAGDGSALFTLTELATARDLGANLTFVIWDNGGYREIEVSFERAHIDPAGVRTTAHDLGAIAAGFGADVTLAGSPDELEAALRAATAQPGLSVLIARAPADFRVAADTLTSGAPA
ncbi:5-guanidino-2-oxopentanoate decarboxylase [Leucobacter luti]|uniref:Acetolactate synthase large subunit n=1 Tax=Leucobacter luti TaxID=340320 RepID=A0A4Q7TZ53_9MICO|nr:5-guanidino-2-oxopentanoate decarboxylase [Leucobacter luti]MBL3698883.1 5-guanidino-2-oxopentanoate decarboxylase [Leucobacter luti]RZT66263.1 acetolactate synthase large subunit [Leucobacter luti]